VIRAALNKMASRRTACQTRPAAARAARRALEEEEGEESVRACLRGPKTVFLTSERERECVCVHKSNGGQAHGRADRSCSTKGKSGCAAGDGSLLAGVVVCVCVERSDYTEDDWSAGPDERERE